MNLHLHSEAFRELVEFPRIILDMNNRTLRKIIGYPRYSKNLRFPIFQAVSTSKEGLRFPKHTV